MPNFHNYLAANLPFNLLDLNIPLPEDQIEIDPPANINHDFLKELIEAKCYSRMTFEKWERAHRSHG